MPEAEPPYLKVLNWDSYQHYKDRNPPWIKLHREMLSSRTWVSLDDAGRVLAVACMMLAAATGNRIPLDPEYVRRVAYLQNLPDFQPLIDVGFLGVEHPVPDASTTLADARPEEEAEQKQSRAEADGGIAYAFAGRVIRLTHADFGTWQRVFHAIPDLRAELASIDGHFAAKGGENWFVRTSSSLNREHQKRLAAAKAAPASPFRRPEVRANREQV